MKLAEYAISSIDNENVKEKARAYKDNYAEYQKALIKTESVAILALGVAAVLFLALMIFADGLLDLLVLGSIFLCFFIPFILKLKDSSFFKDYFVMKE